MVNAVIFDVDGTLVDSVDEHAEAWRRAFLDYGRDLPFAHIRSQIGKGADQLMPVFLNDEELERFGKQLEAHRSEIYLREFMPKVRPFPRVRELFERLKADGVKVALATSAKGEELEHLEKLCGIEHVEKAKTTKDDVDKSKPHPDIFEAAWDELGRPPADSVVVVGDTPYDAIAAVKLGLPPLGVLCGGFPAADLRTAGCRALMRDPAELLERYEQNRETWPWGAAGAAASEDEGTR